jgi:hypothetical protein
LNVAPYREAAGSEILEAPTRDGLARLEIAPRHVVLEVNGSSRVTITDRALTLRRQKRRRARQKQLVLDERRLIVARAVPTDDIALWYEGKPDQVQRVFGITPPQLLDRAAFQAWRELDRLYQRLSQVLAVHDATVVRAAEYGRGPDRVLVEDRGDRDVLYVRPLFRESARRAMEIRSDGKVIFPTRRGDEVVEVRSRFGVTVHGDNINFSGPHGFTQAHIWLPWISEDDRKTLARRFGRRVDASI